MQEQRNDIQEDEIDLRELLHTLIKNKKIIFITVSLVSLLAIFYAYVKKPVYEVRSIIELAQVKGTDGKSSMVESTNTVVNKLKFLYKIDTAGMHKDFPYLTAATAIKNTNNLIVLKAQAYSNTDAKKYLQEIVNTLIAHQNKVLDEYISLQKKHLQRLSKDEKEIQKIIVSFEKKEKDYDEKIIRLEKKNPALAAIYSLEVGKQFSQMNKLRETLLKQQSKRSELEVLIAPVNIKPTHIIGEIEVLENPIKPKKKLIIIVAFITSFILAVFLVFFLEFIKSYRLEE